MHPEELPTCASAAKPSLFLYEFQKLAFEIQIPWRGFCGGKIHDTAPLERDQGTRPIRAPGNPFIKPVDCATQRTCKQRPPSSSSWPGSWPEPWPSGSRPGPGPPAPARPPNPRPPATARPWRARPRRPGPCWSSAWSSRPAQRPRRAGNWTRPATRRAACPRPCAPNPSAAPRPRRRPPAWRAWSSGWAKPATPTPPCPAA